MRKHINCENCKFSRTDSQFAAQIRCHRNPPPGALTGRWPSVDPTDWCGEFQPKVAPVERQEDPR